MLQNGFGQLKIKTTIKTVGAARDYAAAEYLYFLKAGLYTEIHTFRRFPGE